MKQVDWVLVYCLTLLAHRSDSTQQLSGSLAQQMMISVRLCYCGVQEPTKMPLIQLRKKSAKCNKLVGVFKVMLLTLQ